MSDSLPPERANLDTLIDQLRLQSKPALSVGLVFFLAICYGYIAYVYGYPFLMTYLGVLVVVFTLHGYYEKRTRKRIDLLVQIVQKLEEKKRQDPSA
jgi:hypothetical protein